MLIITKMNKKFMNNINLCFQILSNNKINYNKNNKDNRIKQNEKIV